MNALLCIAILKVQHMKEYLSALRRCKAELLDLRINTIIILSFLREQFYTKLKSVENLRTG